MGKQIIKQPNGKYLMFEHTVDNVTHYDMSVDEIIEVFVSEYTVDITAKVKSIVSNLDTGGKPYFNNTMSYAKMLDTIEVVHGKKEMENVNLLIISSK